MKMIKEQIIPTHTVDENPGSGGIHVEPCERGTILSFVSFVVTFLDWDLHTRREEGGVVKKTSAPHSRPIFVRLKKSHILQSEIFYSLDVIV